MEVRNEEMNKETLFVCGGGVEFKLMGVRREEGESINRGPSVVAVGGKRKLLTVSLDSLSLPGASRISVLRSTG